MIRLILMVMCTMGLQADGVKAVVFDYLGVVGELSPMIQADERVLDLVKQLKGAGYRVGILSNLSKRAAEKVKQEEFIKLFDPVMFSYEIGATKPSSKVYFALIKKLGVKPEEILFIDDSLVNVKGAKDVGINTIHYTGFEELIDGLDL